MTSVTIELTETDLVLLASAVKFYADHSHEYSSDDALTPNGLAMLSVVYSKLQEAAMPWMLRDLEPDGF